MNNQITVSTQIYADMEIIWEAYNNPEHIKKWHAASDAWFCSRSQSIFREWGGFTHTMASRDMSMQVDFEWTYTDIKECECIAYYLNDERKVEIHFNIEDSFIEITIHFEANTKSDMKAQEHLWKAILDSFARHAESL